MAILIVNLDVSHRKKRRFNFSCMTAKIVKITIQCLLLRIGCISLRVVAGLEVHMTSSNPLSLLYRTDSSGRPYWKGVSVLINLNTGTQKGVSLTQSLY